MWQDTGSGDHRRTPSSNAVKANPDERFVQTRQCRMTILVLTSQG